MIKKVPIRKRYEKPVRGRKPLYDFSTWHKQLEDCYDNDPEASLCFERGEHYSCLAKSFAQHWWAWSRLSKIKIFVGVRGDEVYVRLVRSGAEG